MGQKGRIRQHPRKLAHFYVLQALPVSQLSGRHAEGLVETTKPFYIPFALVALSATPVRSAFLQHFMMNAIWHLVSQRVLFVGSHLEVTMRLQNLPNYAAPPAQLGRPFLLDAIKFSAQSTCLMTSIDSNACKYASTIETGTGPNSAVNQLLMSLTVRAPFTKLNASKAYSPPRWPQSLR